MPNEKIHILLVDDSKDFAGILCEYIEFVGNASIEIIGIANNGLEAVEMITLKKPDIVILDIIMPYLDGIGVLKQINVMNLEKIPLFIVLSAAGQDRIIQESLDLGAVYFIEKPFDMDVLISKIIRLYSSII